MPNLIRLAGGHKPGLPRALTVGSIVLLQAGTGKHRPPLYLRAFKGVCFVVALGDTGQWVGFVITKLPAVGDTVAQSDVLCHAKADGPEAAASALAAIVQTGLEQCDPSVAGKKALTRFTDPSNTY